MWDLSNPLIFLDDGRYFLDGTAPSSTPANPYPTLSALINFVPQNFALTVNGTSSVTLTWTPILSTLVTGYFVWRDEKIITAVIPPNSLGTYTDTTVKADRRYAYAVSVADISGNFGPQTITLWADVLQGANLTFEAVYQIQPGEGGYPDVEWRWQ